MKQSKDSAFASLSLMSFFFSQVLVFVLSVERLCMEKENTQNTLNLYTSTKVQKQNYTKKTKTNKSARNSTPQPAALAESRVSFKASFVFLFCKSELEKDLNG
jgi:hypothetical protein